MKPSNKLQIMILFIILNSLILTSISRADSCPTPPTRIEPNLSVKIDYEKETGEYIYNYRLTNGQSALIPIRIFRMPIKTSPNAFNGPEKWLAKFWAENDALQYFTWSATPLNGVAPGGSVSGFVLKSTAAPGAIQYYTLGKTSARVGTPTAEDDEPTPDCEGFYDDKSVLDSMVSGVTQGPVGDDHLSLEVELKDPKGEHDCEPVSPYEDKGLLNVLLKGKKGLDVKEIDLSTVRFGVGKAPVVSSKRLDESNNLLLQFKTQDIAIECGRDRVLFLTGKMKENGKEFLGGAPVKTKNCDKRPKRKLPKHIDPKSKRHPERN